MIEAKLIYFHQIIMRSFYTKQQRKLLTKFRISAHNLNIEKGRYIGTKVEDRICNLCKNNIEDEVHFLITFIIQAVCSVLFEFIL
jgi:hypothetical protein